ncbi:MAG: Ig-like domain-containing protein [Acholeplasmataceae bacterium]
MRIKYCRFLVLIMAFLLFMYSCDESPELTLDDSEITVVKGDTHRIEYEFEGSEELTFESSDEAVVTVDENGRIEALAPGTATISIRVGSIEESIDITVRKRIELSLADEAIELVQGDTHPIDYTSNDEVSFESSDDAIASVDAEGTVEALAPGTVTITVRSTYDETVSETVEVRVILIPESLTIEGSTDLNVGQETTLDIEPDPAEARDDVLWESLDDEIATIDDQGTVTAVGPGTVTIRAQAQDSEVFAEHEIEVVDYILVSDEAGTGDTIEAMDVSFDFGDRLFSELADAIDMADHGTTVFVMAGTYESDLTVDKSVTIKGLEEAILTGSITIEADDVTIDSLTFAGQGRLEATGMDGIRLSDNTASDLTDPAPFIDFTSCKNVTIEGNTIERSTSEAIALMDVVSGTNTIKHNDIRDVTVAIRASMADGAPEESEIALVWNTISGVDTGIDLETNGSGKAYARFNSVTDYELAARTQEESEVEFTLNHWGTPIPDQDPFENIDPLYLRGSYQSQEEIPSESAYDPEKPVAIIITSDIEVIDLGESATITYDLLPMDLVTSRISFITSEPDTLRVNQDGVLNPLRSGEAIITVRSSIDFTISDSITITVSTEPGIELTPSRVETGLLVGETMQLTATPFPTDIADETVILESSDPEIASIDQTGEITAHGAGIVTFSARLESDETIVNSYTLEVFADLDSDDLLDLLTLYQVSYATPHAWNALGVGLNYSIEAYESVSRYYFGDIPIERSKMVPVSEGIRPGEPMEPHPSGITQYNADNVYWVVVHDTANTTPGSGALAHANYLYHNAIDGKALWASWHFTVDDTLIYQHLPETERGYHAGDASSLPGQNPPYFGGGNRNGIGIEMSVAQNEDMYRTWQRTAKLVADLLVRYNLPRDHMAYHQDFSGKTCPNTLINSGLRPLFETFADIEYVIRSQYSDAEIDFESHDPEYLDDHGRIIEMPDRALTVSYTITVTHDGSTESRTFYTYLPGTLA